MRRGLLRGCLSIALGIVCWACADEAGSDAGVDAGQDAGARPDGGDTLDAGEDASRPPLACEDPRSVCYDVVYVRYPDPGPGEYVTIPQGEHPYRLAAGADLMLRRTDGSVEVIVDCEACSVMDPYISIDGRWVYYSLNTPATGLSSAPDPWESFLYKIDLQDPAFTPVRMTFDDGFESGRFAANRDADGNVDADHNQRRYRAIRDMAPVPLADGRVLFTSNRSAHIAFHPGTNAVSRGSVQALYVIDDHDGSAFTAGLANLHRLESGNLHTVQHPTQLRDGRLLFSTWQDAGTRYRYGMTTLFTLHPDGSNLQQFTEPHDHRKTVDHFITQLPSGDVAWAYYYPSFDYGFGVIMRAPVDPPGLNFRREPDPDLRWAYEPMYRVSSREFDRVGMVSLTPHTTPSDVPAPNLSGKYSMPSVGASGGMLVAYSQGSVNHFDAACGRDDLCEALRSGIYLIPDADGDESGFITDPETDLVTVQDDLAFNEIWPRAVLSYQDLYGTPRPASLPDLARDAPNDDRLMLGEAAALVGTSSVMNYEPLNEDNPDPFQSSSSARELHDGNWTVEGATAGVFTNDDIYAVRIIVTPPRPYTAPISRFTDLDRWTAIRRHLLDSRLERVAARYGSFHGERWEILGEFPVRRTELDGQGNPDTSWVAKIPSDTPFLIQTIDRNGMTLTSELTWRSLRAGESRTDCGGCHAHSVEPLDISTTAAGMRSPITDVPGVDDTDSRIRDGAWDLTQNAVPVLTDSGVSFEPGHSLGIEFNRDVVPVFDRRCVSCHQAGGTGAVLDLQTDPWAAISEGEEAFIAPQRSRYLRTPQARQSLLVWVAWGARLDGRSNAERDDDIDFPASHPSVADMGITEAERRALARWVDLGGPVDFPSTDGAGYTDDYQLPVVHVALPRRGDNTDSQLLVGLNDASSGLVLSTLEVTYFAIDDAFVALLPDPATATDTEVEAFRTALAGLQQSVEIEPSAVDSLNILSQDLSLAPGEYVVTVSVSDAAGNIGLTSRRFRVD